MSKKHPPRWWVEELPPLDPEFEKLAVNVVPRDSLLEREPPPDPWEEFARRIHGGNP